MKRILLALICLTCLPSCTIDSVSVSTGHVPYYYREVRAVPARVYYYDLRPDYIRDR